MDELLFLSRAEARTITLELLPHDPAELLGHFGVDAQVLAEARGLSYSYSGGGRGRAIYEPKMLRRVLLNLLSNAVHASVPGGQIRVRSVFERSLWRLSIEDEGVGVPAAERDRIFDRFVRLPSNTDDPHQGSGLGLAICRGIIELHHGRIFAVEGTGGRGLRLVLEIPAEESMSYNVLNSSGSAITTSA